MKNNDNICGPECNVRIDINRMKKALKEPQILLPNTLDSEGCRDFIVNAKFPGDCDEWEQHNKDLEAKILKDMKLRSDS